jgi:hypothetical protein
MTDVLDRLLNPAVLFTMIAAGLAYSRLLWVLNLRPTATLVIVAVAPGAIYLTTVWAIRALQGVVSTVYIVLLIDWFIFANTGALAVLLARRRQR